MKGVILLSAGIDSPVATNLLVKRGVEIIGVNFIVGKSASKGIIEICKKVGVSKCYQVDINELETNFFDCCDKRYQCIFCKRTMYRIAERIAETEDAEFIATGENIGQVASQTIPNMKVIDSAVKINVLRPILCFDKDETVRISREIGTFGISKDFNYSCPFVPKNPATKSKEDIIVKEEKKIEGFDKIIEEVVGGAEIITIK